ncbi:RcpC/CpaB family pilus assembly protein [Sanguibacter sp. A247]|uniref:RcpC/CpaB family pilus assembly protein n=1 Tax=unclassified Sanguibacter TaxID=2645534 RepID=UPI003FD7C2AC
MTHSPLLGDHGRAVSTSRRARIARVLAWRSRRIVACAGLGVLAWALVTATQPPQPSRSAVVALARDVPAGQPLSASALTLTLVHSGSAPPCALDTIDAALGSHPAIALAAGTPLCPEMLVRGAAALPPGTAAVPVRLADAQVAVMLVPGTRVDVIQPGAPDPGGAATAEGRVLTRDALVLPSPPPGAQDAGLLGTSAAAEPIVLLAVHVKDAPDVAASAVSGGLGVILVA